MSTLSRWARRVGGWPSLALLAAVTPGCELVYGEDDVFIMSQSHQVRTGDRSPAGHACSRLSSDGATAGGDSGDDFWLREETSDDRHVVRIGSGTKQVERRRYSREFLSAGGIDRFIVETEEGDRHLFMYWGARECQECPPVQFEELPGDPWGCGFKPGDSGSAEVGGTHGDGPTEPDVILVGTF